MVVIGNDSRCDAMKYLTLAIPCYNSESYMERCLDSLIPCGEDIEILIINDGSTDRTGAIADRYEQEFPGIVKAIHQENKGHGGAVNTGLEYATGIYYKVVDSDDWLESASLKKVLEMIKSWHKDGKSIDMLVCNYIYDHLLEGKRQQVHYRNVFIQNTICSWENSKRFAPSQYLIMHALIFRTALLRESGVKLPHHTFYVDNLFVYQPMPLVKTIWYLDVDLYHYFIGRDDQSVNEQTLCRRIDQQIAVTKIVIDTIDLNTLTCRRLYTYLLRNISVMLTISSIHLLIIGDDDALQKRDELWNYVKTHMPDQYRRLRFTYLSGFTYLKGKFGRWMTLTGYRTAKKVFKFQ